MHSILHSRPAWFVAACLMAAVPCRGLDYSVPFVRDGLPYFGTDGVAGFGAIVGQIEVRGSEGNGIDGFDGHRQTGLGPDPGDPNYGLYGYQNVVDFSGANDPTDNNFHGTFVAGVMASEYVSVTTPNATLPFLGMAPLAKYYGAIFDGSGTKQGFLSLNSSLNYVAVQQGATVVNNSWGSTVTDASQLDGSSAESLLMDEYAGYYGKTGGTTGTYLDKLMVISAGNSGADTGLLGSPADCFNGLTVGALDAINPDASAIDDPTRAPALRVAPYSSWRPLANGRGGVDVVAPGTNLWSTLSINYFQENGEVAGVASGTSFAAPHVAGEAALLYGAQSNTLGFVSDKGTFLSTDHKLIKALIINSADKIAGLDARGNQQSTWQPGLVLAKNGVPNAIVPLNYAVGSGSANANEAFLQYRESGSRFWDMNVLAATGSDIYYTLGEGKFTSDTFDSSLPFTLTATLVWDRHVDLTISTDPNDPSLGSLDKILLSDLDLILQEEISPGVWKDIYMSADTGSTVDQIYLQNLDGGMGYRLDVHAGDIADPSIGEQYALVVSFPTVPEPSSVVMVIVGVGVLCGRRRR